MIPRSLWSLKRKYCTRYTVFIVAVVFFIFYFNDSIRSQDDSLENLIESAPLVDPLPPTPKVPPRHKQVIQYADLKKQKESIQQNNEANKNQELEELILRDLAKHVPGLGNDGKPVVLEGVAKEMGEKQLAVIALNEEASEHIR
jgi:hypothetical protein